MVVRTKQQQNTTYRSTKLKFAFIKNHISGLGLTDTAKQAKKQQKQHQRYARC